MSRIVAAVLLVVLVGFSALSAVPAAAQADDVMRWTFPSGDAVYPKVSPIMPGTVTSL